MKTKKEELHDFAYENFRLYLDVVYGVHQNKSVLPLSLGYPLAKIFPLPEEILWKLSPVDKNGNEKLRSGYGWEAGSQPLRETVIRYENTRHNTKYNLSNICMTAGGSYALNRVFEHIFHNLTNGEKEIIIVAPTFYRMVNRASEHARVINYVTNRSNKFFPTVEGLSKLVKNQTKAIFICNPTNPGYNYHDRQLLIDLVNFVEKKKIYLIIDEVGDNFFHHTFFRHDPSIQSKYVIRICSSSKAYQLAEYRLGYVIADPDFIGNKTNGFVKLIGDDMGNPPLAANEAWQTMLIHESNWIHRNGRNRNKTVNDYERVTAKNELSIQSKCDLVIRMLSKSQNVTDIIPPDASFNLTFQFKSTRLHTDIEFFEKLLDKYQISIVPCSGFGLQPEDRYLRMTFAISTYQLKEGLDKLLLFLNEINL